MGGEIVHWNVNGLKSKGSPSYPDKIDTITSVLENFSSTRIFNIQETHFSENNDILAITNIYSHMYSYINTNAFREDRFSGILLLIRNTEEIIVHDIIVPGRLIFVKIRNNISKEILNIFSIYCNSGNSEKQKSIISQLERKVKLDSLDNIIVVGDFNFVNSSLDRNSNNLNTVDLNTSKVWDNVEQGLNIQDTFRVTNPGLRRYSFTSRVNNKTKSRIDRLYASSNICGRIISSKYIYSKASDHKIYKVKFASDIEKGPGIWIFNNTLLSDGDYTSSVNRLVREFETNMRQILNDDKLFWDMLKQKIISFTRGYSKEKASISNRELNILEKDLKLLESLPSQLLNTNILDRIDSLQDRINEHQSKKIRGALLRTKIPSFEECEPKIAFLSSLEKRRGEANTIYNLFDENTQTLRSGTQQVKKVVFDFYSKLYSKEAVDNSLQDEFISKINKQLREDDNVLLEKRLDEEELLNALNKLQNNKTPGMDGLTKEFYVHFWNIIKSSYMKCIDQIAEEKELSEMQKRGAINLIFKKGDRNLIKDYRPISLLNIDLKIITKALAIRLSSSIANLIHENQKAVPGRHIENNIHIVQDLIDYVNESNASAALIFLDQEKAFDRMDLSFTLKTLRGFGFGENFIGWVKTIYKGARSFVKVNGCETGEFEIQRGMRQGCPLSFFLYLLTSETLSSYIRKNKNILGLRYKMKNLEPLEHKINQFADDLEVCVTSIRSIDHLFETLSKFEKATNARINKDKTEALWIGKWKGRQDKPHNLKWTNNYVKFTGIYVGNKVGASGTKDLSEINFAEQFESIKKKITYWQGKGISLTGRIKIVNIFILSRFWYRTRIFNLTTRHKSLLSNLIRNFIWQNKTGGRVRQEVLSLSYQNGGLQLADVDCKIATQRAKHITYLLTLNEDHIERFLADKLIGPDGKYGQSGLSFGLISNLDRINLIKHSYYKHALKQTHALNLIIKPGNIKSIYTEPLFYNKMLLDSNGRIFTLTNYSKMLPKTVKDIKTRIYLGNTQFGEIMQSLRLSLGNITLTNGNENLFYIEMNNTLTDISNMSSKNIYLFFLHKKEVDKEWEVKWENYLQPNALSWSDIWGNIFDHCHSPHVKSSMWEIIHLNFWSGYKARENCKLCNTQERNNFHITNECIFLLDLLHLFNINTYYNDNYKLSFGIIDDPGKNFVLYHIKSAIFKARFRTFTSPTACRSFLTNKCKRNIIFDLRSIFTTSKRNNKLDEFNNNFMFMNDFHGGIVSWHIDILNEIIF